MAILLSQLVIRTSRTVGSAKKFVRIISGFGGGEFTKTLRKGKAIKVIRSELQIINEKSFEPKDLKCVAKAVYSRGQHT
jgi:hypothetical protein